MTTPPRSAYDDLLGCLRAVEDSLVARHLMTAVGDLVTADDEQRAADLSRHHDFEVIPRVHEARVRDYWWRQTGQYRAIGMEMVVAGDTRVLDLLDFFVEHRFGFVLTGRSFGGYLHYSDLNKQPVKIAFYVQFEAAERIIRARLARRLADDPGLLDRALGPHKAKQVRGNYEAAREADVDIGIVNAIFNFGNLLSVAQVAGLLHLNDGEPKRITEARNKLMHANEPLLRSHSDVGELVWLREALPRLAPPAAVPPPAER